MRKIHFLFLICFVTILLFVVAFIGSTHAFAVAQDQSYLFLPIIMDPVPPCIPLISGEVSDNEGTEQETLAQLNAQRVAAGLSVLQGESHIIQAARHHSHDMADNNFESHQGSDGSFFWERMKDACYDGYSMGEIIGWGFGGDTSRMINWWMNSDPHRDIILSDGMDEFGAGFAEGGDWGAYWTVDFGYRPLDVRSFDTFQTWALSHPLNICHWTLVGEVGGVSVTVRTDQPCP